MINIETEVLSIYNTFSQLIFDNLFYLFFNFIIIIITIIIILQYLQIQYRNYLQAKATYGTISTHLQILQLLTNTNLIY